MRRNEIADATELRWAIARVLDEATVQLLALTSTAEGAILAAYEERDGVPAYDAAPGIHPTDVLKRCRYCDRPFWAAVRQYCSQLCSQRYHLAQPAVRERRARADRERYLARKRGAA